MDGWRVLGPYRIGPNDTPERGIYTRNALVAGADIPSNSVDLVFCDPEYKELGQYSWLAGWTQRVLKPGGNLMCQVGSLFAYECEEVIREVCNLTPRPRLYEILTGGYTQVWVSTSLQCVKTYLWFTKAPEWEERRAWVHETVRGGGRDKQYHDWGDSPGRRDLDWQNDQAGRHCG